MNASAMFIRRQWPRIAIRLVAGEFFAIQADARGKVGLCDEIAGDLATADVQRFFDVTKGAPFEQRVLGKIADMHSAIRAAGG